MRSEAQKAADKKYRETHKGSMITWSISLKPDEAASINEAIMKSGMNKVDFIRWAIKKLKEEKPEA